jgi:hypothetical protein
LGDEFEALKEGDKQRKLKNGLPILLDDKGQAWIT